MTQLHCQKTHRAMILKIISFYNVGNRQPVRGN